MQIEKRKISDLKYAEYNPRKRLKKGDPEYIKLRNSIEKFGYVEPVIVNERTGNIVGGHQRITVLKDIGEKEADCVIVNLDEQDEKALNIALNKISGEWDSIKLEEILRDLKLNEYDVELTGFDLAEIDGLLGLQQELEAEEDDFDVEAEKPKEAVSKYGQIYKLGRHRLMCGDSTKEEDVARLMSGGKARILFTSPPYSDMREYNGSKDLSTDNLSDFIKVYKPYTNHQCVNLGLQRKEHEIIQYWDIYIEKAKQAGYKLMAWNVWDKTMCGSIGQQSAFFPIRHEWIFIFGTEFYDINLTESKKETSIQKPKIRSVRQPDGSMKKSTQGDTSKPYKKAESVTVITSETGNIRSEHPAVFPIELPSQYIKSMTNINETVIEPFGGSGTTLIACEQLNRVCYMMELDPIYVDVIIKRWEKLTGEKAELIEG